jgi:hypothetical protein
MKVLGPRLCVERTCEPRISVDSKSMLCRSQNTPSLVPGWKRGHFSLLYDATGDKGKSWFVNHTKKTFVDMKGAAVSGTRQTSRVWRAWSPSRLRTRQALQLWGHRLPDL